MNGKRQFVAASFQHRCKHPKIGLEVKVIKKLDSGQSLLALALELGLLVSTVNTTVKDTDCVRERERCATIKFMVITKQCSGAIYEMEKLLTIWMEKQIQKCVTLSMMLMQSKAGSLYGDINRKFPDAPESFAASMD
jgi:hypothetical protein